MSDTVAELAPEQRAEYARLRAQGQSHNIAVMLASCEAPTTNRTDDRWRSSDERREHGRRAPLGKYQPGLARFPGDPLAFVRSRAEAQRRAEEMDLEIIDPSDIFDDLNDPASNGEWEDEESYGWQGI
jgi:hypothetical protein